MTLSFDLPRFGFAVRRAHQDDARACRMLLPQLAGVAEYLVAVENERALVIGAAAATNSRRAKSPAGPGVAVHVIPPCRRCGVARELMHNLVQWRRQAGDDALYAAQRVDLASDEFQAWRALGFEVAETVEHHELAIEGILPRLAPIVDWLRAHQRIPPDARIVPLYAADREQVLNLHLHHLGGDRDDLRRRLGGQSPESFHPRYSRVLTVGSRVAGCVLARRSGRQEAAVDAVIVAPEYRNDWASVWLRYEACQGAAAIGVTRFVFSSFDQYQDTRLFTAQSGGAITRTMALMARPLTTSAKL